MSFARQNKRIPQRFFPSSDGVACGRNYDVSGKGVVVGQLFVNDWSESSERGKRRGRITFQGVIYKRLRELSLA
ncbi:hypothetical protein CEXT_754241 [Caerostris extrusa]|uniref:Uncharacterized protein n=1 Tax=Caerostris extrusa TaxID=172846 RepID=A0AAV4ULZ2_CAEEX|nr:hypothetical protein CEXT_754241 [Caerostris extrusa]